MPLPRVHRVVQDSLGNVVPQVLCSVLLEGTGTLATLWQDDAGTIPMSNPMTSDATYGSFDFYVTPAHYDLTFTKPGYVFQPLLDMQVPQDDLTLGTMAQQDANAVAITGGSALLAALTVTGLAQAARFSVFETAGNDQIGFQSALNAAGGTNRYAIQCYGTAPSLLGGALEVVGATLLAALTVTGATALSALTVTGAAQLGATALSALTVTGAAQCGTLTVTGLAQAARFSVPDTTGNDQIGFQSALNAAGGTNRYAIQCHGTAPSLLGGPLEVVGATLLSALTVTGQAQAIRFHAPDTAGSNQFAFQTALNAAGGTNRYAIQCYGTAPSFLGGSLEVTGAMGLGIAPLSNVGLYITHAHDSKYGLVFRVTDTDTGSGLAVIGFNNLAGTAVGSITTNATATAYNTSSDARLKHAITALTGALDVVQALRPVTFRWNADDSVGHGFLAHELQQVVPDAVSGLPDAVGDDGSVKPQQVDHSKLVPWLTAALQEAVAQVQALSVRVASLETQLGV